jgi:hypothetical protein
VPRLAQLVSCLFSCLLRLGFSALPPHIVHMPHDPHPAALASLGSIEPHAPLLRRPPAGQLLYKVMSVENCIRSIEDGYLHFNRVDQYKDFTGADQHLSRSRTYAFCASLENSDHVWTYSSNSPRGNVGIVFDFDKLRATINRTLQSGGAILEYNGVRCRQIFDVNYGLVRYVDWVTHRANETRLPNPIMYTYMKDDSEFAKEQELRVSLSTLGMGKFVLDDLTEIAFPPHLHLGFDFRAACADGTIREIICGPRCDEDFLRAELWRLGAAPCPA